MQTVPIGKGHESDPHYRYIRPVVAIHSEKDKTVIENLEKIANALHIPSETLMAYFKCKLNTRVKGTAITGKISASKLESLINEFIEEYILCPSKTCRLPELHLRASKKKNEIVLQCKACGHKGRIKDNGKITKCVYNSLPKKQTRQVKIECLECGNTDEVDYAILKSGWSDEVKLG
uniref:Translation initiation factor IF2/IF5 domain-containing protein n=1 Tax=viral metagenome TaxID=1070528 RepID=A0A6C0ELN2_9ZZZZ